MHVQWTSSVGIEEIDRRRPELFAAAERLTRATHAPDVVFEAALRWLLEVACAQFAVEEQYLRDAGHATLTRHESEHRRFLADVASLASRVAAGERASVDALRLSAFVTDWMAAHGAGADRELAGAAGARGEKRRSA